MGDFDAAQQKLRQCKDVLLNDFFLVAVLDDFIENARLMIFETFCRIHQCISINMLAEKLNMTGEDAERWIVNLIRNARLDAKIDSQQGHVVMATQTVSPINSSLKRRKCCRSVHRNWPRILRKNLMLVTLMLRSGITTTSKESSRGPS